jgi:hypothetical protein
MRNQAVSTFAIGSRRVARIRFARSLTVPLCDRAVAMRFSIHLARVNHAGANSVNAASQQKKPGA